MLYQELNRDKKYPDGINRARDRVLVYELLKAVARNGGQLTEAVALEAVQKSYATGGGARGIKSPRSALNVIKRKLQNPNIRAALADVFEFAGGFTIAEAVEMHVKHIRGFERQTYEDGELVTVSEKPNYQALRDYERMALPEPAKKLEVGFSPASAAGMFDNPSEVQARALGPAVVENRVEATTVEFSEREAGDGD